MTILNHPEFGLWLALDPLRHVHPVLVSHPNHFDIGTGLEARREGCVGQISDKRLPRVTLVARGFLPLTSKFGNRVPPLDGSSAER